MVKDPTGCARSLLLLQKSNKNRPSLRSLFESDKDRFSRFSRSEGELLLDFSRTSLDVDAFHALLQLAGDAGLLAARDALFRGEKVNRTEDRAVLHSAWRQREFDRVLPPHEAHSARASLSSMRRVARALRSGQLPGAAQGGIRPIRDVIHVGIGGSLLGPRLLCEAFAAGEGAPRVHFLSSVDAGDRERLLTRVRPEECVLVLVSKSFTTGEVLHHGRRLGSWMAAALGEEAARNRTFAVTAEQGKAAAFGVSPENTLELGQWTGGRYSLWSPVSLTAAMAMGQDAFDRFCAGGAAMDRHFREAPFGNNLPVIHALLAVWHRNVCGYPCRGLIPYDSRLRSLPAWLQQLEMESNGKSVTEAGEPVGWQTSPVILGETGTDAQHALFQAFHQGTEIVPLEFVGVVRAEHEDREAQQLLLANLLAQATALAFGRDESETRAVLEREGHPHDAIEVLLPHRLMPGDRPSLVLMLDRLTPENFGALLTLYEHSVFVESVIWGINAFDQWGVELGKVLANSIAPALADDQARLPPSARGLDGLLAAMRRRLRND